MKKLLVVAFITILLFGSIINLMAQDKHFGVRAGYQNSSLMLNSHKQGQSLNGYYAGAFRDTKMLPFMFFHSGIEYMQMGGKIENNDYVLNYIGVPLGLKFKVGPLYAVGGAMVNFKISEKGSPYDNKANWYDSNVYAGAGLEILIFCLEAKYMWGLTDVNNGLRNDAVQIGCGIRF
ncbi:outer membrane beta-barrel protein [Saccharicrinis aurantiacus]|uniref:outer membrane beta-barrel protein n=1 Tax=Saccharicrinis aurantiacus TaxID=1849719 RepID=UPI0008399598|nr:outer membrane beta-barrel protein [Saccharicrinis aurantiacus]